MQISSIPDTSAYSASALQSTTENNSSFASIFQQAAESLTGDGSTSTTNSASANSTSSSKISSSKIASTASTSSSSKSDAAGEAALEEFMHYASETPEQRLFSGWLESHGISEASYSAMSPTEQAALRQQFAVEEEQKLKEKAIATLSAATSASSSC